MDFGKTQALPPRFRLVVEKALRNEPVLAHGGLLGCRDAHARLCRAPKCPLSYTAQVCILVDEYIYDTIIYNITYIYLEYINNEYMYCIICKHISGCEVYTCPPGSKTLLVKTDRVIVAAPGTEDTRPTDVGSEA